VSSETTSRIADLHERISAAERRRIELDERIAELERETVSQAEAESAFADFDTLWANLIPREQARLLSLLISTVEYDGEAGTISVTFRPTSIRALIDRQMEDAA
jgi:septal ring factor EnvC (AmiA/AmiB activator)